MCSLVTPFGSESTTGSSFALTAARTANGLLLFDAAQFAFGDVPALTTDSAEDARVCHALTEAAEKLFLRFTWFQFNRCHKCAQRVLPPVG
jgi:hypothetical protein